MQEYPEYQSIYPNVKIPNLTLNEFLFQNNGKNEEHVAFLDGETGNPIYHKDLQTKIHQVASGLYYSYNIRKGDTVCIYAPNSIYYPIIVLACSLLGSVVTCANNNYTENELLNQIKDSNSKLLVLLPTCLNNIPSVLKSGLSILLLGEIGERFNCIEQIKSNKVFPILKFNKENEVKETLLFLPYSSGTTGKSKAVCLTHYNIISNIIQISSIATNIKYKQVTLGVLPFFHIYGSTVVMLNCIYSKLTTIVMEKFQVEEFFSLIQKYKIEGLCLVPPIILALANCEQAKAYNLSSIKWIVNGAAPLSEAIASKVIRKFGIPVRQAYGLTETSPAVSYTNMDEGCVNTSGRLMPNIKAKIVDIETGKNLPPNHTGELWVKGPNVTKGYFKDEKANINSFSKCRYFKTGDIAKIDQNGFIFIVDRIKELIKYKGFQVAPAELESILLKHDNVLDCCVIGIKCDLTGEIPKAYVVPKDKNGSKESILQYLQSKVAPHKKLRGGVEYIDVIPKSASGKILRRILIEKEKSKSKI